MIMNLFYKCLECDKHFIGNDHKWDVKRCPDCNGPLVSYHYGIDLARGKDKTVFTPVGGGKIST